MYFSGDPSAAGKKRVALGGKSTKESELQVHLEQARLERKRRQTLRLQNKSATIIQKCFRGLKVTEQARLEVREHFCATYGDRCQKLNWNCFGLRSDFLRQFLFFIDENNESDIAMLHEICKWLLQYARQAGDVQNLFSGEGEDYSSSKFLIENRVKKLVNVCLQAVYKRRTHYTKQLLLSSRFSPAAHVILLEGAACLLNPELPWVSKVIIFLQHKKVFGLLREIVLAAVEDVKTPLSRSNMSSLEEVIILISSHTDNQHLIPALDPKWSFSAQLLSIPFFWQHLSPFKEVFFAQGLIGYYIHEIASYLPIQGDALPQELFPQYLTRACILGNFLEASSFVLSKSKCNLDTVMDIMIASTILLDELPAIKSSPKERELDDDVPMDVDELNNDLKRQILSAVDAHFLEQMVNAVFQRKFSVGSSEQVGSSNEEVEAVCSICAFLYVTFNTLPLENLMTPLAYRTEIVSSLWCFIKECCEKKTWPFFSKLMVHMEGDAPGWLLPLAVFSPIYMHMLMIIDNEEFYEQEKPLPLKDIASLVVILKQALWELLWIIPSHGSATQKLLTNSSVLKKLLVGDIKSRARVVIAGLLTQLQDWNSRRSFTSFSDFRADEAGTENFVSQAINGNTRASEVLKLAPFLVPFTSRVRIYTAQLAASRQRSGSHPAFSRQRFKIRRNQILEDAFSLMNTLSEEDIRGSIRITFVNDLGMEEAGIDGGGIFKDFMENVIQAAFGVQYGLFKETADHLLYPNPGSGMVHENHLQYFHFLGILLAKAMYEGILVDLPFATFFLSKLKQKHNFLNDLPSLDPELYRHLLFLKHYQGDIGDLELYFVIVNNEYGEQSEDELLPGGKNVRVTNDNVISFIHLVANHRLNHQIRNQSTHFLRGFQNLILKDWIDMFSEHEIQLLISGSLESLDVDDLRSNSNYTGGYDAEHPVILIFWEILKELSIEQQKKFLKFVTGCSRGPLLGFQYLEPRFCIQRAGFLEEDVERLPTAATCMNLLKLPSYKSKEQLRSKLLYSINAEAGFDLS